MPPPAFRSGVVQLGRLEQPLDEHLVPVGLLGLPESTVTSPRSAFADDGDDRLVRERAAGRRLQSVRLRGRRDRGRGGDRRRSRRETGRLEERAPADCVHPEAPLVSPERGFVAARSSAGPDRFDCDRSDLMVPRSVRTGSPGRANTLRAMTPRRLKQTLSGPEWLRLGGFAGAVAALHIAGWGLFVYYSSRYPALAGLGVLAYTFGSAARLRRRPHRGDRQHDPEDALPGQAPARGRLLLLARPLDDRLLARRGPGGRLAHGAGADPVVLRLRRVRSAQVSRGRSSGSSAS